MTIFEEKGTKRSPKTGSKTTLATGGRPVTVTYGGLGQAGNVRKKKWTKESLIRLQAALNLSDRGIKKFAAATRVVFGRDSVDLGLISSAVEKNKP